MSELGAGTTRDVGGGIVEITDLNGFLDQLRAAIGPRLEEHAAIWEREGPALMRHAESLSIVIDAIGGNCPVQAEGSFDGKRFYFRARGDGWQFHVADTDEGIFGPDEWMIDRDYGDGPFDAGWMHKHEAVGFICQSVEEYRRMTPTPSDRGLNMPQDQGVPAAPSGHEPSASAADASSRSRVPNAVWVAPSEAPLNAAGLLHLGDSVPGLPHYMVGTRISSDEAEELGYREYAKYGGWLIWHGRGDDFYVIAIEEPRGWMPLTALPNTFPERAVRKAESLKGRAMSKTCQTFSKP